MFKKNIRYLIKTPTGFEHFEGVQKKKVKSLYTFQFYDNSYIKCSGKHLFLTDNGFEKAENISLSQSITNKKIRRIIVQSGNFEVYDPVGVVDHSTYFAGGVISHNTEFIGSASTLVSGAKLRMLSFFNPILTEDNFDMYEQPQKNHMYVCTIDCSEGIEQDYSTINVIDVSQVPYKQVAKFRDNKVPLLIFPNTIYSIATKYNEAFVLVETNNIGQQVVDILHYDLEYDHIYKLEQHNIKGQTISGGFKRSSTIGIKTTKTVKKIGCANLKTLIETDKLIIVDFQTIAELNTFIRNRDTFSADEGCNDDLVMGLVLFGWLAAQAYFKDSTNMDIRKILLNEQNIMIEQDLVPAGYVDNGLHDDIFGDDTESWSTVFFIPNS